MEYLEGFGNLTALLLALDNRIGNMRSTSKGLANILMKGRISGVQALYFLIKYNLEKVGTVLIEKFGLQEKEG